MNSLTQDECTFQSEKKIRKTSARDLERIKVADQSRKVDMALNSDFMRGHVPSVDTAAFIAESSLGLFFRKNLNFDAFCSLLIFISREWIKRYAQNIKLQSRKNRRIATVRRA